MISFPLKNFLSHSLGLSEVPQRGKKPSKQIIQKIFSPHENSPSYYIFMMEALFKNRALIRFKEKACSFIEKFGEIFSRL